MGSAAIVTVTGASLVYHNAAQYGGGIYNAGQLRLDGALVISNTCGDGGGGIHNANGLLTLSGAQVLSNTAGGSGGGGVYSQGFSAAVTVTAGSLLQGNVAARGGGLYNLDGWLDIVNARLIANAATSTLNGFGGGGVYNSDGLVSLEQAQILSNTAAHDGGGILNISANDLSAVTLANVQLIANAAGNYGGAISSAMGTTNPGSNAIVTVTAGSLLEANTSVRGGGVHIFGGQAVLRCSQVISNTAALGGAIYQENGQASVNGSAVAGNSSVAVQVAGGSTPLDAQQNWWGAVNGPSGSGPGSGDAVSSDVQFAPFVAAPDGACPTLGGTVTGLAGSGLALQNNGGDDLAIGVDGPFTFATGLVNGSAYNVTLKASLSTCRRPARWPMGREYWTGRRSPTSPSPALPTSSLSAARSAGSPVAAWCCRTTGVMTLRSALTVSSPSPRRCWMARHTT